uniref:Reverse transcriptase domain-containing protein n=1 Tax=Solanum lycopersicum TaxID=4081 RepID=A0A3Q7JC32_SOLLC
MEQGMEPNQFQDQEAIDSIASPEECMTISLKLSLGHQGKKRVFRVATTQVRTTKDKCHHIQAITTTVNGIPVVLVPLMEQYKGIFDIPTSLPPHKGPYDHRILLIQNAGPVSKKPYRFPRVKKDIIEKLVQEMLDQGVVQHSTSPYASLVDGSWRLCIDYMDLNYVSVKDKFPFPIIKDLLNELGGWLSSMRMAEFDVHKIAFKTHDGHYEFLVMPFGFTIAPSSFQSLMNSVFKPLLRI